MQKINLLLPSFKNYFVKKIRKGITINTVVIFMLITNI